MNKKILENEIVKPYFIQSIQDPNIELEYIYGENPSKSLTKLEFMKLISYFRKNYECIGDTNTLDIRKQYSSYKKTGLENIRCTIQGIQDIRKYCQTNSLEGINNIEFLKKSFVADPYDAFETMKSVKNSEYNYRLNIQKETILQPDNSEVEKFKENFSKSLKFYRYKKRYSFITDNHLYRIDITAVKNNTYNKKNKHYEVYLSFLESNILQNEETYEFEIEYIGSREIDSIIPLDSIIETILSTEGDIQPKLMERMEKDIYIKHKQHSPYIGDNIFVYPIQQTTPTPGGEYQFDMVSTIDKLFPIVFGKITSDPIDDIKYEYWEKSDQLFIYDILLKKYKQLSYREVKKNTKGNYKNAPDHTDYAIYQIYPEITIEEYNDIVNESYIPTDIQYEDLTMTLYIPIEDIIQTSESVKNNKEALSRIPLKKLPSWAPKKDIQIQEYKEELVVHELKKNIYTKLVTYLVEKLNQILVESISIIQGYPRILSFAQISYQLDIYKEVTFQKDNKYIKLIGPQPVSMTKEHVNPENPNSIFHGYMVTEKADGIRAQMLINKDKDCVLITQVQKNNHLEVIDTGLSVDNISGTWILDGEYITQDKSGNPIEYFMIFDIYFAGNDGKDNKYPDHAYTYPWISKKGISRSMILEEFKRTILMKPKVDSYIHVGYKTYYEGSKSLKESKSKPGTYTNIGTIGKLCQKILKRNTNEQGFGYNIDGLIFLPMYSPVGSLNDIPVDFKGGSWYHNYKWKPPEENTIDFRVEIVKEDVHGKQKDKLSMIEIDKQHKKCKQVKLYVTYNIYDDTFTDFAWKLLMSKDKKVEKPKQILFQPDKQNTDTYLCNLPFDKKLTCQKDNIEIKDNMIIEMRFNPSNPYGSQWEPLRHRFDKTYPNKFTTAYNIWDTIHNPVTLSMIEGKELPKESPSDQLYYISEMKNSSSPDQCLRDFHNYIKQKLISCITSIGSKPISILDTSVGRGGDIQKYLRSKNHIAFFMGLDISDNIQEAAKRYYLEYMKKPNAIFMQYDTSESIQDLQGLTGSDYEKDKNKHLIDILYNKHKKIPEEYKPIAKIYKGLCNHKFTIISSQFSLHYYFKNEITLRGYLKNISDNCKKQGYFIGTCYDGKKVFQLLSQTPNFTMTDEYKNKVFSIQKQYDIESFNYNPTDKESMFGNKIDVYMNSIGQTITEYLVNFEMFVDIMKEYDFTLVNPECNKKYSGIFDNQSYIYEKGIGGFEQIIKNLQSLISNDPIFKLPHKPYSEAIQILKPENKSLLQLSSLNNWFIFLKK